MIHILYGKIFWGVFFGPKFQQDGPPSARGLATGLILLSLLTDSKPFSDDSRFSKLVRRFCRDDDRDRRVQTGKQLEEACLASENIRVSNRTVVHIRLLHQVIQC